MRLDRAWIESRIPHHGHMCLLDEVLDWNEQRITCKSASHRTADNPLRAHGRLGIACGIEYAAQAMAVHGALAGGALQAPLGRAPPDAGFLVGVRRIRFHASRLDDVAGDLLCEANRTAGDSGSALYDFALRSDAGLLLTGSATVLLQAGMMNS